MEGNEKQDGLSRRSVLKRGAIVGGAMVWTVPAVQTIAGPAFAAGTGCAARYRITNDITGDCVFVISVVPTDECCACINTRATGPGEPEQLFAVFQCIALGTCTFTTELC